MTVLRGPARSDPHSDCQHCGESLIRSSVFPSLPMCAAIHLLDSPHRPLTSTIHLLHGLPCSDPHGEPTSPAAGRLNGTCGRPQIKLVANLIVSKSLVSHSSSAGPNAECCPLDS
ncbi:hypothetical protein AAFF_G00309770 [Aldrovandia affinis]|uniref:Uncharacterized protein n=1 Tax=Aldrovandia affinis TaxID=143900 RepID=A0AAD7SNT5_9TELE|nr:hypothetical protein AAFF_G00309770 [Aldrovandia affinis]